MKPSKLIFALAGIMTVAGANALSTDEVMAMCNSSKDTVWDSFNKTCVPRNPCTKDKYALYCNKEFASAQLSSIDRGVLFAKAYAKYTDGQDAACSELDKPGIIGQDYIGCTYSNGHYVVFEFDDLSQHGHEVVPHEMFNFEDMGGQDGCYGFEHNVGSGGGRYGTWVKSSVTPKMCLVEHHHEAGSSWKLCVEDDDSMKLARKVIPIGLEHNDLVDCGFNGAKSVIAPDGTSLSCYNFSCNWKYIKDAQK